MRKILSAILTLSMLLSLTITAMASSDTTNINPQPIDDSAASDQDAGTGYEAGFVYKGESDDEDAAAFELNTLTTHPNNAYLYWVNAMLDEHPTLHYDASMKQYYLVFGLRTSSKLAAIFDEYYRAFQLEKNVETLRQDNTVDAMIWNSQLWLDQGIGERLSETTAAKIRASSEMDGYAALKLIQQSAEYENDERLKVQVDYNLHVLEDLVQYVANGFLLISSNDPNLVTVLGSDVAPELYSLTPVEICQKVDDYLAENPEWKVLGEVYNVAATGFTSKAMTTFEQYDAEKLDELYAQVSELAKVHWPSTYSKVESMALAVPFSVGTTLQWSEDMREVAEEIDNNRLPISATIG